MSEKLIQCEECGTEHPVDECGSGTPPPAAAETLEEIAESIARRGLPFSAFRNEQEWKVTKAWLTNEVLSALRNERERCAKVAEEHKFSSEAHRTHSNLCTDAIAASIREGIET